MSSFQPFPLHDFRDRTVRMLGAEAVTAFSRSAVAITGCGGVGGAAAVMLARMGFERFVLADPGRFDPPDSNRQWGAFASTFGRNKAEVYAHMLADINPRVEATVLSDGVTPDNATTLLDGVDVLVDCMDMDVSPSLRMALYEDAERRQIFAAVAPILGFGGLVVAATPGGPPLAEFGRIMSDAIGSGTLPPQLFRHFVPDHLLALGRSMRELKAPSVSVAPSVAAGVVCSEIALHVLGPEAPGGRPPITLPDMVILDLFKGRMEVIDLGALASTTAPPITAPPSRAARSAVLAASRHNAALVPPDMAELDLATDSWLERSGDDLPIGPHLDGELERALAAYSGFEHIVPLHQGRLAEAVLASALLGPGRAVIGNRLFPTTQHHITAQGASFVDATAATGGKLGGDPDLARVAAALDAGEVQAVWIELCCNALGGQPVSLAALRRLRALATAAGVPLILDATRAMPNAVLVARREPSETSRAPREILRELFSLADATASSLSKDFVARGGGWIGARDPALFLAARDRAVLAYGDGLDARRRAAFARAVRAGQLDANAARVDSVQRLGHALVALGVPLAAAPGGHALLVDASAFFPRLSLHDAPAQALINALYREGGVKASHHVHSADQVQRERALVRLAVPVGGLSAAQHQTAVEAFGLALAVRDGERGLDRAGDAGGEHGPYLGFYSPKA